MKTILRAIAVSLILMILCGLLFPLAMTGISQLFFYRQANGSMMQKAGAVIGSELLGQNFTDPRFFHGRVSAVNYNTYKHEDKVQDVNGKTAYTGVASGSSNLAPSNPELVKRINNDIAEFLKANPGTKKEDIPTDLLTCSGSGLDPDISPEAARIQIPAIAKATGLSSAALEEFVKKNTQGRQFGLFGEPRVNIMKLNLEISSRLR